MSSSSVPVGASIPSNASPETVNEGDYRLHHEAPHSTSHVPSQDHSTSSPPGGEVWDGPGKTEADVVHEATQQIVNEQELDGGAGSGPKPPVEGEVRDEIAKAGTSATQGELGTRASNTVDDGDVVARKGPTSGDLASGHLSEVPAQPRKEAISDVKVKPVEQDYSGERLAETKAQGTGGDDVAKISASKEGTLEVKGR
ncbi:hypothetical protein SAICODRAFT_8250 [Saitoella complicata NRRL Y-17804]|uniref:Uncharacterized protein n=1 Tax=Saitoella complicata (strain BCRC 22490 / CBS 7301 / JCM 7358 / NBRC 10748 / NRRL Y-17804) TaxID=698492 RepID=A0A0E9NP79_SAICN|nr:uncharacterized protein SAICODRAFT_8250 [Saitoella complicata NRRL Y-17804]ODQ52028.1 hypothetical protein SAICODRAFT_8250 [Saitoella complicata NRRL Y-17804]GAO51608.1 hypothetical protein G7K_5704-t1 [Saitoella complicata NRRL Y-17804]